MEDTLLPCTIAIPILVIVRYQNLFYLETGSRKLPTYRKFKFSSNIAKYFILKNAS